MTYRKCRKCSEQVLARSLCKTHYFEDYRKRTAFNYCNEDGCDRGATKRGLCPKHRQESN